ncbi:MAG: hypothetical protein K940chlam3_00414 [Chlamydiae bacterium]|nr:hypothetical protein [Chlamydiota bacterium]
MTQTMPKLYQYAVCPFCKKVEALLAYKKIPFEAIEVHPLNKKELKFSEEYKKVPIYIDTEGKQINDSTSIMRHIDADESVFDNSEKEDKWVKWADEVLVRALPPLIYDNFRNSRKAFNYITKVGKFSFFQKMLIKYSGSMVMMIIAKKSAKRQNIPDPVVHFKNCLDEWGKALEDEFLNGKNLNGADIVVFGILGSIDKLPAFKYVEGNKKVFDWYKRMKNSVYN